MDRSLIYVSRRTLAGFDTQLALDEIVAAAKVRNQALQVTGGLVCTALYFAQLLEGSTGAIDALMQSIGSDLRHTDLTIIEDRPILHRSIATWMMGYDGNSHYVARHLEAVVADQEPRGSAAVDRLRSLIVGFATADGPIAN